MQAIRDGIGKVHILPREFVPVLLTFRSKRAAENCATKDEGGGIIHFYIKIIVSLSFLLMKTFNSAIWSDWPGELCRKMLIAVLVLPVFIALMPNCSPP